jgi:chitinase
LTYPNAWTDMVSTASTRATFIDSAVEFMGIYGFQGIDLDWEHPVDTKRGRHANDMVNLVQLVKEMRSRRGDKYGITLAITPDLCCLQHYDAKGLLQNAD